MNVFQNYIFNYKNEKSLNLLSFIVYSHFKNCRNESNNIKIIKKLKNQILFYSLLQLMPSFHIMAENNIIICEEKSKNFIIPHNMIKNLQISKCTLNKQKKILILTNIIFFIKKKPNKKYPSIQLHIYSENHINYIHLIIN